MGKKKSRKIKKTKSPWSQSMSIFFIKKAKE